MQDSPGRLMLMNRDKLWQDEFSSSLAISVLKFVIYKRVALRQRASLKCKGGYIQFWSHDVGNVVWETRLYRTTP